MTIRSRVEGCGSQVKFTGRGPGDRGTFTAPPRGDVGLVQVDACPDRNVLKEPFDVVVAEAHASVGTAVEGAGIGHPMELMPILQLEPIVAKLALNRAMLGPRRRYKDGAVEDNLLVENEGHKLGCPGLG